MADLTEKMIALSTINAIETEQIEIIADMSVLDTITGENAHSFINNNRLKPIEIFATFLSQTLFRYSSYNQVISNINANINRLGIVVSTLNGLKDMVNEIRNELTRASDQTITDTQRDTHFYNIKQLFKQILLLQFHADFNTMNLFNINIDLREIDIHYFTNVYTSDIFNYKAQIGFDTNSTVDYDIKCWPQDDTLKNDLSEPTLLHSKAEMLIDVFQKHEQELSSMITSHRGVHDFLKRQSVIIEDEYEAAMFGIEEQRSFTKEELVAVMKNNQNRVDLLNATVGYRGI